jgi:predicted  nucleic acid-binding Zn-ribbon protein
MSDVLDDDLNLSLQSSVLSTELEESAITAELVTDNLLLRMYQPGGVPEPDDPWFDDHGGTELTQAQKDLLTRAVTDAAVAAALAQLDRTADDISTNVLAQARQLLDSVLAAGVSQQIATLQTDQQSIAIDLTTVGARLDSNVAAIQSELLTYADKDISLAQSIDQVTAGNATAIAAINETNTAYTNADTALGQRIDTVVASVADNRADIVTEQQTRVDAVSALATQLNELSSTVGGNSSTITSLQTTLTNANQSNAASLLTLTTTLNGQSASISSEITARTTADSALSTRIDTLTANLGTTNASITAEQTARANGDSANATSITNLTTTVNGHTSSISSNTSSINGVYANYAIKLDNNGYIAGFGLYSTVSNVGVTSYFNILADRFTVQLPGWNGIAPFTVGYVNGNPQVVIQGAYIADATIGNAAIGNAQITNAKIANAAIDNAKIANLQVDTLKLGYNSVSSIATFGGNGTYVSNGGTLVCMLVASLGNPAGAVGSVQANINGSLMSINGSYGPVNPCQVIIIGSPVGGIGVSMSWSGAVGGPALIILEFKR